MNQGRNSRVDNYTLISYVLTKHCSSGNSYIVLELNIANLDQAMERYKISIVGTSKSAPMPRKPDRLDTLFKELLAKLTEAIGNDIAFGYSKANNIAYIHFSQKARDKYVLLTI